jgi:hypothetical protein
VATRLSEHGTPVHVIEHILGHWLPALIRTYQLHVPLAEMREALDWWSEELDRILDGQPERWPDVKARRRKGLGSAEARLRPAAARR